MLKRSRVTGAMDVNRLAAAVRSPGIDPRSWVCIATVLAFKLDQEEGAFADVLILSTGQTETVRVGAFYAGPGFGFYAPLDVDDEVVVVFPDGNPDSGGAVVARLWSMSDPPADLAKNHATDVCLQVKKDATLRVQVFGSGNVVIGAENGKVLLGDETGTLPVARKTDPVNLGTWTITPGVGPLASVIASISVTPPGGGPPVVLSPATPGPFEIDGEVKEGSDKVESS